MSDVSASTNSGLFQQGHPALPRVPERVPRRRMYSQQLLQVLAEEKDGRTNLYRVASKLVEIAIAGDVGALKEIGDRIEGKPVQMISGDPDGSPLVVEIVKLAQLGAARVIEHEDCGGTDMSQADARTCSNPASGAVKSELPPAQQIEMITGSPVEPIGRDMRCVLNSLGNCLANTPEACLCKQMPESVFRDAHRKLVEPQPGED